MATHRAATRAPSGDAVAEDAGAGWRALVAGTHSHPALRTAAHTIASWLPDARYLELDCGHVTYAEQPEQLARAVAAFASEATSSRPVRSEGF